MITIFRKFFDFCSEENRKRFYKSIVLAVIKTFMDGFKITAIAILFDAVLKNNVTPIKILTTFGVLMLSAVLSALIKSKAVMLQTEAGYYTGTDKRVEIAEHLRYLPMGYFNKNSLGYITSVTTNVMEALSDIATRVVMLVTEGIITTTIIGVFITVYDWRVGLVVFAGLVLFVITNALMQHKSKRVSPRKVEADSRLVSKVIEYIQGIAEVKAYHIVGKASKELNLAVDENIFITTKLETTFIPFMALQLFITKCIGIAMTMMSVYLYLNGMMELLVCVVMVIASFIIYAGLETAGSFSALLRVIDTCVDKASDILRLKQMDIEGKDITPKTHNIEVKNISFSYDNKKIIDNVSLVIPERTVTAFVGPSGGGKTTLCNLISRFWDVDSGEILIDGHNVREYSMNSLMKNFSFVFQNVYLFRDTIANNIRFGQPDAPIEKVIEAAKLACCYDFISALPDGFDTIIGEGGASLSGGEKQRISIARAIMKDAPIIILDEATANVDPENEKDLMSAIDALTKEKTIIMIAHRLKTVKHADQIVVIDQGHIVQHGKHAELIKEEGIYKCFITGREKAVSWKIK